MRADNYDLSGEFAAWNLRDHVRNLHVLAYVVCKRKMQNHRAMIEEPLDQQGIFPADLRPGYRSDRTSQVPSRKRLFSIGDSGGENGRRRERIQMVKSFIDRGDRVFFA